MSVLKGYTSKVKQSIGTIIQDLFATFQPIRKNQVGLDVIAHGWTQDIASDAVEATSTVSAIKATSHVAQVGDIILFTSGVHAKLEVKVIKVESNWIYLGEDLSVAPTAGDTFNVTRHKYPRVTATGDLNVSVTSSSQDISFQKNGSSVNVTEDTVTPANNIPLPVKLMGVNGALSITTDVLDISSTFATDSMNVTGSTVTTNSGTTDLEISKFGSANLSTANFMRAAINMATTNITSAAYVEVLSNPQAAIYRIMIFEGHGAPMYLAIGQPGVEVIIGIIPPGGMEANLRVGSGVRISVKAVDATLNTGYLIVNALTA